MESRSTPKSVGRSDPCGPELGGFGETRFCVSRSTHEPDRETQAMVGTGRVRRRARSFGWRGIRALRRRTRGGTANDARAPRAPGAFLGSFREGVRPGGTERQPIVSQGNSEGPPEASTPLPDSGRRAFAEGSVSQVGMLAFSVASAASAGTGGNKTGQACYKGMYVQYQDPSTRQPFASQDACVSFVANGGTLLPEVDVSVTSQTPSSFPHDPWPGSADVVVHNSGAVAVTAFVTISLQYLNSNSTGLVTSGTCEETADQFGRTVGFVCHASVPAAGTYRPLARLPSSGASFPTSIAVTAGISLVIPGYPDPNTNNNVTFFNVATPSA
jgi:hypothetical protein